MTTLKRALLVIALGPLTLAGLSSHAQANSRDSDVSGAWRGTCTKITGTGSWDAELVVHEDDTYLWTSAFPPTKDSSGSTVKATGRVDRASERLIENEPQNRTFARYSINGRHMRVEPENGMSRCSLTR